MLHPYTQTKYNHKNHSEKQQPTANKKPQPVHIDQPTGKHHDTNSSQQKNNNGQQGNHWPSKPIHARKTNTMRHMHSTSHHNPGLQRRCPHTNQVHLSGTKTLAIDLRQRTAPHTTHYTECRHLTYTYTPEALPHHSRLEILRI